MKPPTFEAAGDELDLVHVLPVPQPVQAQHHHSEARCQPCARSLGTASSQFLVQALWSNTMILQ